MKRTGNQGGIAAGVAHPLQIAPRENAAPRQQPHSRKPPPQRLDHAEIDSTARSDSTEIKQEQRRNAGPQSLLRQAHRVRPRTTHVLHSRVKNRGTQLEVEAEHQTGRADHLHDCREVGKGMECLQTDHHLTGAAAQHLQRPSRLIGPSVHQQRPGEAGVKLSQLAKQRSLECATLYGIEIGDVALMDSEDRMKSTQQRYRVAGMVGYQPGGQWTVLASIARLGMYGHPASQIQNRNDLHALCVARMI